MCYRRDMMTSYFIMSIFKWGNNYRCIRYVSTVKILNDDTYFTCIRMIFTIMVHMHHTKIRGT